MFAKINNQARIFDMVGLMDIIFLLLIFGMVVAAIKVGADSASNASEELNTLEIVIGRVINENGPQFSTVSIRNPNENESKGRTVSFPEDKLIFKRVRNNSFSSLPAVIYIDERIKEYAKIIEKEEQPKNYIRLVADENTPLAIIGYVLEACREKIEFLQIASKNGEGAN